MESTLTYDMRNNNKITMAPIPLDSMAICIICGCPQFINTLSEFSAHNLYGIWICRYSDQWTQNSMFWSRHWPSNFLWHWFLYDGMTYGHLIQSEECLVRPTKFLCFYFDMLYYLQLAMAHHRPHIFWPKFMFVRSKNGKSLHI